MLDADTCYRAMVSRDRRFEGRFIIGVRTTGIYCRPGCPARTPKRGNVSFYACCAAAQEAGLRPCLRCRPDAAPGSSAWAETSTTVHRALRLIAGGALDGHPVEELAARLGMGDRHLRRLFLRHVGASPLTVASTRRVHFARKLLEETRLPVTEVAHAAGFESVRRFNEAVRRTFARTPTELRRTRGALVAGSAASPPGARGSVAAARGEPLCLRLPYRPPLAWDALLGFLARRAIPGVEVVEAGTYARSFALGDDGQDAGTLEVRPAPGSDHLVLALRVGPGVDLLPLVERARRLFDLDAHPLDIAAHLRTDPALAAHADAWPGLRVPGAWDGFELAVRAILGQQVTVKGATTLSGRVARQLGRPLPRSLEHRGLTHVFPTPQVLAAADLSRIGLPTTRQAALRALASAAAAGRLGLDGEASLEELVSALTALPGVGAWTAQYVAMRAGREPDAFPAGDLVLRRNAARFAEPLSARALEARAELWRPWRAYAAMHLWMLERPLQGTTNEGSESHAA